MCLLTRRNEDRVRTPHLRKRSSSESDLHPGRCGRIGKRNITRLLCPSWHESRTSTATLSLRTASIENASNATVVFGSHVHRLTLQSDGDQRLDREPIGISIRELNERVPACLMPQCLSQYRLKHVCLAKEAQVIRMRTVRRTITIDSV